MSPDSLTFRVGIQLLALILFTAVFVAAGAGGVSAVEPGEVWDEEIAGEEFQDRMQGMTDDYVVLASADSDSVYVLNRTDGSVEETVTIAGARSVAGDEDTAYVGVDGGEVIAINPSDGTQLWSESVHSDGPYGQIAFKHGVLVSSAPADGYVVRIDPSDGSEVWSTDIGGNVRADTDGESVVVGIAGLGSETVHVLEPSDGSTRFTFSRPDGINGNDVAVGDGVAISVSSLAGSTYAFDTESGSTIWDRSEDGNRVVADGPSEVVLIADGDTVRVRGLSSGSTHGSYSPGSTRFTFAVDDGLSVWAGRDEGVHYGRYFGEAQLSNFDPTSGVHQTPIELSVDVLSRSDLTVDFYDADGDSLIASESTNGAETVTTQWDPEDPVELSWYVEVGDVQSQTFDINPPPAELENPTPSDGEIIDEEPIELSVFVDHPEFDEGEEVDVEFTLNGDFVDEETVTECGFVNVTTTDAIAGENLWNVSATDTEEQTVSIANIQFFTPNILEIRDESNPDQLVDDTPTDVEVRFIVSNQVFTRSTTDGTVDMSGLPVNEEFVVEVAAENYTTRQSLVRGIIDQQEVYILPEDVDSVETQFIVSDPTGQIDPANSRILVKKPITRNGETEFRTVVADLSGTSGFSTLLERDQRYLIEVEDTTTGEIRELGPYVATSARSVELEIDEIEFNFRDPDVGYSWNAQYVNQTGNGTVKFNFEPDHSATVLSVKIERVSTGEVVYENTVTDVTGAITLTAELPEVEDDKSESWRVTWTATIVDADGNEEVVSDATTVGEAQLPIDIPGVDDSVLSLVGILAVLAVGGLFSAANVGVGGVATALTAGGLWMAGILPNAVSGGFILIALLVAVLYHIQQSGPAVPNR